MATVLITGCSSGFGFAGALAFARQRDTVYASVRDVAKAAPLRQAAARESLDIRVVELDVRRPTAFAPLIESIVRDSHSLDVLVNNAGVLRAGAFEDLGESMFRDVVETNFFGPFLLTRAVLPQMRAQRSGYIIMISSLSGIAGLAGDVAYTASKFAMEGGTEALRHEVDRWNIRVALVEAGLHATGIFDASTRGDLILPDYYPQSSPYRALVERGLRKVRERLASALDPAAVGELLVRISRSDGRRLRWPADEVAKNVLATMFAQDDTRRDEFLRSVSDIDWWSTGDSPDIVS